MVSLDDIVITGVGCVTPVGIGGQAFAASLKSGICGVRLLVSSPDLAGPHYGAIIDDFDGRQYITPRKAVKVMCRQVQTAYAAAHLAWQEAAIEHALVTPERIGVIYGSEMMTGEIDDLVLAVRNAEKLGGVSNPTWAQTFPRDVAPLWMLKHLPNMPACHVSIAIDARGPSNTIAQEEVSSLEALVEAISVIEREHADVMVVGSVGCRVNPARLAYRDYQFYETSPGKSAEFCRPFDSLHHGIVPGQAAGAIVIERRRHAIKRGAKILATVLAAAGRFGRPLTKYGGSGQALVAASRRVLEKAEVGPEDLSHLAAQGYSHPELDRTESEAIEEFAPGVWVTAASSYVGSCGASSGMMSLIASLFASRENCVFPILGFAKSANGCNVRVCKRIQPASTPLFMVQSFSQTGHAAAAIIQSS
ncbi:MAG: hypothetical protein KDB03_22575 [Planctomycetales bacterium]|nr:hypothetical protein [Planctomycetales bacterium]